MATFTVVTTGVFTDSQTGTKVRLKAGAMIDLAYAVRLAVPGAALPADSSPFTAAEDAWLAATLEGEGDFATSDHTHTVVALTTSQARTATAAPGGTTGVISVGTDVVTVTSDDANKVITLPDATLGTVITLLPTATGYELRSSAPATIGINGGTAANAESAIPADIRVIVQRVTATNWVGSNTAADGTVTVTEVAA